jgi:hypothetical protein
MSRMPAHVTQADVARCIRAAMKAGAGGVEVRPDGTIFVHLRAGPECETTLLSREEDAVF